MFWSERKWISQIFVPRIIPMINNVVIRIVSVCVGGIIHSSIIRNMSSYCYGKSECRASGAIVEDMVTIGDYRVFSHIVDVFDASWSSLPSTINGIIGLGEESCNPTCLHPFYHSILEKEIENCPAFPLFFTLRRGRKNAAFRLFWQFQRVANTRKNRGKSSRTMIGRLISQ